MRERERERERETDRERETEREGDRQTDRQRQRDRESGVLVCVCSSVSSRSVLQNQRSDTDQLDGTQVCLVTARFV